jgi:transcriptional regulator with XRE-family HTH domain
MTTINLKNVKTFMGRESYSEIELSKAMGISYSYLFRVLRGDRKPGAKFIEGLLKAGMEPNEIFLPSPLPNGKIEQSHPAANQ